MATNPSEASAENDPFSEMAPGVPLVNRRRPAPQSGLRKLFAGLMLVTGVVLIAGSYFTARSLRTTIMGNEAFPYGGEFRAKQEEETRLCYLGLCGCAVVGLLGLAVCWGAYRVYEIGLPTYQGSGTRTGR